MKIWGSNYLTTDAGDLWTSWASLDKHHWTHLSRSDMASRSGIASRSDIVGRSDIQSVGSVFLLVLARLSVRSNGIYIYIYIYIYKERGSTSVFLLGLALFGDVISYIRCKDSARAHIFALHCASGVQTDLSSNSIQQHRVPAWPAGRPREYQHSLLVVQGNINTRTFVLTSSPSA